MTSEIKPVAFKRGFPQEQKNGLYGMEEQLLSNPQEPVFAVVTLRVDEIVDKELAGERYPIVVFDHVEPMRSEAEEDRARALQEAAYKARTGANELSFDFDESAPEGPEVDFDTELADTDVEGDD